jgi:DNA-binding NtrC family response regulator
MNDTSKSIAQASPLARLDIEAERSVRYRRPLAIAVIATDRDMKAEQLEGVLSCLRQPDEAYLLGPRTVLLLLPETSDKAEIPVRRVLRHLGDKAAGGIAQCPADGSDAASLIEAAQRAAARAHLGEIESARFDTNVFELAGHRIVVADPVSRQLFGLVRRLSRSTIPVLLVGETGTGKEVTAAALHCLSPRREGPFVAVNCAALPESLLESELFGHERGAFSGAERARAGLLESASGGTMLLDEISEASPRVQAELLRVIETQTVRRLGAVAEMHIDVRLVAATNRPVQPDLDSGRLRRDLYYRLGAAAVRLPPLRERPGDIEPLWHLFIEDACRRLGRPALGLSEEAKQRLLHADFPGNVRQLRQLAEYLAAVVDGPLAGVEHLEDRIESHVSPSSPLEEAQPLENGALSNLAQEVRQLEIRRIRQALEASHGVRVRAAEILGMPLRTLVAKIARYGLSDIPSSRERRR